MGSWHVEFRFEPLVDHRTRLEYFINDLYRAAIVYGRGQMNDNIVIDGLWKGKNTEDWTSKIFDAENRTGNCDRKRDRITKKRPRMNSTDMAVITAESEINKSDPGMNH